ncbi:RCC1 domain-containing protein [Longimicrobium sp.]|uniref:RCC1 domain-containing protein n=1 Tax=Longimicrobium sp. TaxID=2029185 RepID=UPI003B3B8E10
MRDITRFPRRVLLLLGMMALAASLHAQPARWTEVSVGDDHACALDAAGRAWCWGNNHSGQLGARTPEHCGIVSESGRRACYPTASEAVPLPAGGEMRFANLAVGRYVTCGADARGAAFCWGQPLGPPDAYADRCLQGACSFGPVPLEARTRFTAVDMAARCGVQREGTALCWGHDFRTSGTAVKPWPGLAASHVAGDPETSTRCAVAVDGRAFCRGGPEFGFGGNGSRDSASQGTAVDHPVPFTQVAVLGWWACGLDAEGAAHCWGAASYDDATREATERAGFERCERWGTQTWCNTRPAPVAGGLRFRSITAMPRGSMPRFVEMVGLTASGEAYVWDGARVPRPWNPDRRWASISAGDWGQCGVTTGGELFCWGRDPHEEVQGRIAHPEAR